MKQANGDTWEEVSRKLSDLQPFIQYLQCTKEDEWAVDVVRTREGKNCLFGHLINWYYGDGYEGSISRVWDLFEEMWMTTYVLYEVNDGRHPNYQQTTPKQRVLAYMKNLWLGLEVDTQTGMRLESERNRNEHQQRNIRWL